MKKSAEISKVLVVGGTHGNEPTGVYLLEKWQRNPGLIYRSGLATNLFLANPEALKIKSRYVDKDLNRCFLPLDLDNAKFDSHEDRLARKINRELGPRPKSKYDLIIDMHTSTADMGITLICDQNPETLKIAATVKARLPKVHIYQFEYSDRIQSCLRSIAPLGIGIEIGPIPQNVLKHDILRQMEDTVSTILDVAQEAGSTDRAFWPEEVEVFRHLDQVKYPMQATEYGYIVHRDLEELNYRKIPPESPVFIGIDGDLILYAGPDDAYAVFVNEAAYYKNQIAFALARRMTIALNPS